MSNNDQFQWTDFYTKFADKLLEYKDNRSGLINKVQNAFKNIHMSLPKLESNGIPDDIDPFTVYGLFNKGLTAEKRTTIIKGLMDEFSTTAQVPEDFSGIPILNNVSAAFYAFTGDSHKGNNDIENLWHVFTAAMDLSENDSLNNREVFIKAYDTALKQYKVRWNLSMGLFWIRPYDYLNLDATNRKYLSSPDNAPAEIVIKMANMKDVPTGEEYLSLRDQCKEAFMSGDYPYTSFPSLSDAAWIAAANDESKTQEKYQLIVTAEDIQSNDKRFTKDNLSIGDDYIPLDVYFQAGDGTVIRRKYGKGERKITNQTLPRLACQIFEKQIAGMSVEEREDFPICQNTPEDKIIRGIYYSVDEYQKHFSSSWCLKYTYDNGRQFVFYSWNIFSTLVFVQECLKRFGNPGDQFVLTYREKSAKEDSDQVPADPEDVSKSTSQFKGYLNPYSQILLEAKNIIFHGAPGTGKSYLAREIAADIVSNGYYENYDLLSDEQKEQIEFVQFHPSYDYTDFVEGLRPVISDDGHGVSFELRDGIFKQFVDRARKNYENASKTRDTIERETSAQVSMTDFFNSIEFGKDQFKTISGNTFYITDVNDEHISVSIPDNPVTKKLTFDISELRKMLESGQDFKKVMDIQTFFGKEFGSQSYSYDYALFKAIKAKKRSSRTSDVKPEMLKKYIFIIDEINRGEISKIFGELFFAIDPGYRGEKGSVSTQYANMHTDPAEKFYIPENVYIIGTMNDIDRSVDSFDFAMRRRFRFIELKAGEHQEMLSLLNDDDLENQAISRMDALNAEIAKTEGLNENYQIGAAYFLKLKSLRSFDLLWTDYLEPLLSEYVQGMYNEKEIMKNFANAYGYKSGKLEEDEAVSDQ